MLCSSDFQCNQFGPVQGSLHGRRHQLGARGDEAWLLAACCANRQWQWLLAGCCMIAMSCLASCLASSLSSSLASSLFHHPHRLSPCEQRKAWLVSQTLQPALPAREWNASSAALRALLALFASLLVILWCAGEGHYQKDCEMHARRGDGCLAAAIDEYANIRPYKSRKPRRPW